MSIARTKREMHDIYFKYVYFSVSEVSDQASQTFLIKVYLLLSI